MFLIRTFKQSVVTSPTFLFYGAVVGGVNCSVAVGG